MHTSIAPTLHSFVFFSFLFPRPIQISRHHRSSLIFHRTPVKNPLVSVFHRPLLAQPGAVLSESHSAAATGWRLGSPAVSGRTRVQALPRVLAGHRSGLLLHWDLCCLATLRRPVRPGMAHHGQPALSRRPLRLSTHRLTRA